MALIYVCFIQLISMNDIKDHDINHVLGRERKGNKSSVYGRIKPQWHIPVEIQESS